MKFKIDFRSIIKILILEFIKAARFPLAIFFSFLMISYYGGLRALYTGDAIIQTLVNTYGEAVGFGVAILIIANIIDRFIFTVIFPSVVKIGEEKEEEIKKINEEE